jgi:UDP:flavonoid glycosyltransferase YjiC (YdhE family)
MARVLVAWEFGGGMGHLTGVVALAVELLHRGHAVALAVPQPERARPLLRERLADPGRVDLLQGIGWSAFQEVGGRPAGQVPTLTLADVMMLFGWDDPKNIGPRMRAWENLVAGWKPDLAIADFAPALRLAMQGRLPMAMMGTGYSIPPAGRLLPPIRPWQQTVAAYSRANEGAALASVNRLRQALRMPAVDFLADAFHGDQSYPCTIPAFDPYRAYRQEATLPPHNIDPIEPGPPLPERPGAVLVHLPAGHRLLSPALWACHRRGLTAEVVLRGGGDLPDGPPPGVHLHTAYVDLAERLPAVRACVHHGGLGLSYAAAMAATPQLLLTEKLEHRITATALAEVGTATTYADTDGVAVGQLAADLERLTADDGDAAVRRFAAATPRDGGSGTLARIADFAEAG